MQRRAFVWSAAALVLAACSRPEEKGPGDAGGAPADIPDPAAIVAPLYQPYLSGAPFRALEDQAPWTASLREALLDMMARSNAANEPILDFDPIIGAQDGQIAALAITTDAVAANSHAVVRAHFVNLGREEEILYDLVWEGGGWRIDNIRGRDWDLRQIVASGPR